MRVFYARLMFIIDFKLAIELCILLLWFRCLTLLGAMHCFSLNILIFCFALFSFSVVEYFFGSLESAIRTVYLKVCALGSLFGFVITLSDICHLVFCLKQLKFPP